MVVVPSADPALDDAAIHQAVAFQETAGHYVLVRSRPTVAPIGLADTG